MKAKFIGDPNDDFSGPKVLRFGFPSKPGEILAFPKDVFVPVTDDAALSLMSHNHFVVEEGDAPEYVAPEPKGLSAAQIEALDGDDNGSAGGSLSKADILERLARYPDAEYDARWGAPKLKAALEAAEFAAGDDD